MMTSFTIEWGSFLAGALSMLTATLVAVGIAAFTQFGSS